MLATRADELKAKIDDLTRRKRIRGHVQAFATRATQLEGPAERLDALARTFAVFRAHGLEVALAGAHLSGLQQQLHQLREAYAADRTSIVRPDGELRFTLWQPLKDLPDQVESALRAAWERHVATQVPEPREELLAVMERVPGFGQQVASIRALHNEAKRLSQILPASPDAFPEITRIAGALHTGWGELSGDGLPAEVLDFLRAATTGGASRVQFTLVVERWLETHELMPRVRITLGGARP
jgi:hypothetical protein